MNGNTNHTASAPDCVQNRISELLGMRSEAVIVVKNSSVYTEKVREAENVIMNVDYLLKGVFA